MIKLKNILSEIRIGGSNELISINKKGKEFLHKFDQLRTIFREFNMEEDFNNFQGGYGSSLFHAIINLEIWIDENIIGYDEKILKNELAKRLENKIGYDYEDSNKYINQMIEIGILK